MQGRGTRAGRRRMQYERASRDLQPALPDFQAVAFVGTMAGQMIRWGFMGGRSPAWAHGLVTMTLAFVVVVLKIVWPAGPTGAGRRAGSSRFQHFVGEPIGADRAL